MADESKPLPAVLKPKEVADLMRVSVKTFYRRAKAGQLPFRPIKCFPGRYSRDAVLAAIGAKRVA